MGVHTDKMSPGFASYELIRGPAYLELLNPAEVFGNIMIEYSYPECTTACMSSLPDADRRPIADLECRHDDTGVTGLSLFRKKYPDYRAADIDRVSRRAIQYIHDKQRPDGSWYGSWAIVSRPPSLIVAALIPQC